MATVFTTYDVVEFALFAACVLVLPKGTEQTSHLIEIDLPGLCDRDKARFWRSTDNSWPSTDWRNARNPTFESGVGAGGNDQKGMFPRHMGRFCQSCQFALLR